MKIRQDNKLIPEKNKNINAIEKFFKRTPDRKGPKKNPNRLNSNIPYSNILFSLLEISVT